MIPILWQTTAEVNLLDKFRAIMHDVSVKLDQLPPAERLPYILNIVDKKPRAAYFQTQQVTAHARGAMEHLNRGRAAKTQFSAAHLADRTPWGTMLPADCPLDEPLSEEDFMLTAGLSEWLLKQSKL